MEDISTAPKTECQSAPAAEPYIGCKINLISMLDIRYEGTLHAVNGEEKTFTLSQVRSFGTEDRHVMCRVEAPENVYQFVVFKASNVKDMFIPDANQRSDLGMDPAVLTYKPNYFGHGNRSFNSGGSPISSQKRDSRRRMDDGFYNNRAAMLNNRALKTGVFEPVKGVKPGAPQFTSDYDFMRANEVFKQKLASMSQDDEKEEELSEPDLSRALTEELGDKNINKSEIEHVQLQPTYSKKVSFFDNISCETVEKSEGTYRPHDWQTERKVNQQTFGFHNNYRRPFNQMNRRPINGGNGYGGNVGYGANGGYGSNGGYGANGGYSGNGGYGRYGARRAFNNIQWN